MEETKRCNVCNTDLPVERFSRNNRYHNTAPTCYTCLEVDRKRKKQGLPIAARTFVRKRSKPTVDKVCRRCKERLPLDRFYCTPAGAYAPRCRDCQAIWSKEWRAAHPDAVKRASSSEAARIGTQRNNWKVLGLEWEDVQRYLASRASVDECDICGTPTSALKTGLSIDHDHHTGKIRGLLCRKCNMGLGLLGDGPALLEKALAYLAASRS